MVSAGWREVSARAICRQSENVGPALQMPAPEGRRLFFSWIVCGVHVRDPTGPNAVKLDYCLFTRPCKVLNTFRRLGIPARLNCLSLALVELVAEANVERPRYDRHVLVIRMNMGWDLETGGELEAYHVATFLRGITNNSVRLRTCRNAWRSRAPLRGVALKDRALLRPCPMARGQKAGARQPREQCSPPGGSPSFHKSGQVIVRPVHWDDKETLSNTRLLDRRMALRVS